MKKILFASTALVAFAGAASAEVALSGSAEMGVSYGVDNETLFHQSVDVRFSLTGESDSGLSFGATIDLEDALDRAAAGDDTTDDRGTTGHPDYTVFISGAFGTLTMGDTDGAVDWAITDMGNIGNPGSIADDETTHAGYFGTFGDAWSHGGHILRYDYAFGDLGVAVSAEMDPNGTDLDPALAIGLKYALDLGGTTVNLGAGYHTVEVAASVDQEIVALGASATFGGGFSAGVTYADIQTDGFADDAHIGVGLGWASGPIALHANYGEWDLSNDKGYGITAAYDLGGGLSVNAGYGHDDFGAGGDDHTWSLGLKMAF